MKKEDFKIGEDVNLIVYSYDEEGNVFKKEVSGKVIQITNSFVVINNGKYNESFKYSELQISNDIQPVGVPYDLKIETYEEDIVNRCVTMVKKGEEGFVFNYRQMGKVIELIKPLKYSTSEKDGLYFIKKIN